jgi:lysophospholipase L1-like esterase
MLLIVLVVSLLLLEICAQIYFYNIESKNKFSGNMYRYDKRFGWSLVDGEYTQTHYDFRATYHIMGGKRLSRSYVGNHSAINLFGDSFTFGVGVPDEKTIASFLGEMLEEKLINNYGVSGYGPDQYYLYSQEKSRPEDLNIFIVFSGNDYKDINSKTDEGGAKQKPHLRRVNDGYRWEFPEYVEVTDVQESGLQLKSVQFVKHIAKSIPFVVNQRSQFIEPNKEYVDQAISRINYLYGDIDKDRNFFVIVPSYSIVSKISNSDDEGYFVEKLDEYFDSNNFRYLNLSKLNKLDLNDYWPNEGHPNHKGNHKIARMILDGIRDIEVQ